MAARFRLKPDAKRSDIRILSQVRYQICDALSCTPYDETFFATAEAPAEVIASDPAKLVEFKGRFVPTTPTPPKVAEVEENSATAPKPFEITLVPQRGKVADPVKVLFRLSPEDAKPGQAALLSITMELDEGWHTFALNHDPKNSGLPTLIELTSLNGLKAAEDKFSPSLAPEIGTTKEGIQQRVHHKEITWTMPVSVEKSEYGLAGTLRYQICNEGQCRPLKGVPFELGHIAKVAAKLTPEPIKTVVTPTPPAATPGGEDGGPTYRGQKFEPRKDQDPESLGLFVVYAFLGGLILNVMPCVLPVIAIKVLSFVQQAGESRSRILLLNLTYSLGVIAVFLLLASLAILPNVVDLSWFFAKLGMDASKLDRWGGLFQMTGFQVAMSCLVFAMGLSLLGVFEIPVPGMIGSAAGHQHQEGPLGAFLTGIFATLLATPCSGPFLGVTLGWSVKQPAHITYLVWSVMGLGMASPYVLLGFFPGWVKFLPRPGNWMVTFKEVCGFILMGTVIFLMSSLKANWILPLLILLLAIGFSLWMIGHLYTINSPGRRRWTVRTFAAIVSGLGCWMAMGLADEKPGVHELPWQAFDGVKLKNELRPRPHGLRRFHCRLVPRLQVKQEARLQHGRHSGTSQKAQHRHDESGLDRRLAGDRGMAHRLRQREHPAGDHLSRRRSAAPDRPARHRREERIAAQAGRSGQDQERRRKADAALTSANDFKLSTTRQRVVCLLKSFATRLRVVLFLIVQRTRGLTPPFACLWFSLRLRSSSAAFEFDVVLLHLFIERRAVDAEQVGGLLAVPTVGLQRFEDELLFRSDQRRLEVVSQPTCWD